MNYIPSDKTLPHIYFHIIELCISCNALIHYIIWYNVIDCLFLVFLVFCGDNYLLSWVYKNNNAHLFGEHLSFLKLLLGKLNPPFSCITSFVLEKYEVVINACDTCIHIEYIWINHVFKVNIDDYKTSMLISCWNLFVLLFLLTLVFLVLSINITKLYYFYP